MKKFIKFTIVITLIFFTVVISLEYLFKDFQNNVEQRFNEYEKDINNTECLLIGNSHIQAIGNPDINKMKSFNFSFGGQDIFHIYSIVKTLCNNSKNKLKLIIIGIDYDLLGYNYDVANTVWKDRLYFKKTNELYDSSFMNKILAKSNFFNANRDFAKIITRKNNGKIFQGIINNGSCLERALEHSKTKFKTDLIEENLGFLEKIHRKLSSKKINYVIINPPKTNCYRDNYLNEDMHLCEELIKHHCKKNNVKYFDFFNDKRFNDLDFVDYDHLNIEGVNKLIKLLNN